METKKPEIKDTKKEVTRWIKELSNERFEMRAKAIQELTKAAF